ncbi:MAG TPA: molybdopterin-dependent oxidoreductase [Vicinamibacteria bacterium]|nr:molybdopterin-dependent oxidoreductase [Vicinamibacteria bacterium]
MNETRSTSCVLDCPDTCSLEVQVSGSAIRSITAGAANPVTGGFICSKVGRFAERVEHEDRLLYPMRRIGPKGEGRFERVSWDEALSEVASRWKDIRKTFGAEAILPYHYGGSNGFVTDEMLDSLFFARLGASRLAKTICAAPTSEVAKDMYGKMAGVAFPDYVDARCIVIWGANPRASNIHLVPYLKEAKRRGAFIALVDPIRTLPTELVDLHLPVRPGTDLLLALGLIDYFAGSGELDGTFVHAWATGLEPLLAAASAWPLEKAAIEAGLDLSAVRDLAKRYASSSPAVLRCGWGVERNRNGGHAVAAILAIPCLLGKFGVLGGGYTLSNSGAGRLVTKKLFPLPPWNTRTINMTELASVLRGPLSPPVKSLFVFNCNPVATVPDQNGIVHGLMREDLFTVVFEQVMTDTARFADVLLPATTFFEHHDLKRAYGSYVVGATRPVVPPRGEARSNVVVFQSLARALGFDDDAFGWSEQELIERTIAAIELNGKKPSPGPLKEGGAHGYDFDGGSPIQFKNVFPETEDGKVHLTPRCLGSVPYRYRSSQSSYPLTLVSSSTSKTINSTLGEFNLSSLHLSLNPEDARSRGIRSGDRVRAFNSQGEVLCYARVDRRLREGVVHMPKGAWRKASLNGSTSTALTPAEVSEVGGGACFNDARVEVARLDPLEVNQ